MWQGVRHRKLRKLRAQFADPETRSVSLNIRFHKGSDQIWAEVVGVPGLATQGRTVRDLMNNLSEAISLYFDVELDYPDEEYVAQVQSTIPDIGSREPFLKKIARYLHPINIELNVPVL